MGLLQLPIGGRAHVEICAPALVSCVTEIKRDDLSQTQRAHLDLAFVLDLVLLSKNIQVSSFELVYSRIKTVHKQALHLNTNKY